MKRLMFLLLALVCATPASAQVPANRPVDKDLNVFAGFRRADSVRIRSLEARADSLTDRVAELEAAMRALSAGMMRVTGEPGKADASTDDLWTMLAKLVNRVCRGDRTNCP